MPVFLIRRGLGDGRVTTAPWAEAMARWMKGRFPVRAEYAEHRLLNPPIDHIGNTKAALAASGLRNPDPANHARAIGSVEQVTTKHGEQFAEMRAHLVDALSIRTRRPAVCATCANARIRLSSLATSSIVIAGRVSPSMFLDFGTAYRTRGTGWPVRAPGTALCGLSAVSRNRSRWPAR